MKDFEIRRRSQDDGVGVTWQRCILIRPKGFE